MVSSTTVGHASPRCWRTPRLYGDEALRAFVADHVGKPPQALIQALTGLLDDFGDGLDDDTALLAVGIPALTPDSRTEDTEWVR